MFSGSLPTIFNIYTDARMRSSQHEQAQESCGAYYYLQSPENSFLPFQFECSSIETVTEIKILWDVDLSEVIDISGSASLIKYRDLGTDNKRVAFWLGGYSDVWQGAKYLDEGRFVARFKLSSVFSTRYLYSDTFEIPNRETRIRIGVENSKLITIAFSDTVDFEGTDGSLYHQTGIETTPYFEQRIYLNSMQSKFTPSIEREDAYKDRFGLEAASFKLVNHRISFQTIVPYSVYRGLTVAQMCDRIQVIEHERGRNSVVTNMQIEATEIGEGAFYQLDISFDENNIIKRSC